MAGKSKQDVVTQGSELPTETTQQTETTQPTGQKEKEKKRVRIHLFKDSDRYKDDVTVAVNGKLYVIKRGVDVEVPESVKEVLDNSQKQDLFAEKRMEEFQKVFEASKDNL